MKRIKNIIVHIRLMLVTLYRALVWLADPANIKALDQGFETATKIAVRYVQFYKDHVTIMSRAATAILAALHSLAAAWKGFKTDLAKNFQSAQKDFDALKTPRVNEAAYKARCQNAAKARAARSKKVAAKKAAKVGAGYVSATATTTTRGGVVEIPSDRHFD